MRVMVFVKATEDSEKGIRPTAETAEMFEAMAHQSGWRVGHRWTDRDGWFSEFGLE